MSVTGIERQLLDLPSATLQKLVVRFMFELTITARTTYDVTSDAVEQPELLRAHNEVQHRLAGALLNALDGKSATAVEILVAQLADHDRIASEIHFAFRRAMTNVCPELADTENLVVS